MKRQREAATDHAAMQQASKRSRFEAASLQVGQSATYCVYCQDHSILYCIVQTLAVVSCNAVPNHFGHVAAPHPQSVLCAFPCLVSECIVHMQQTQAWIEVAPAAVY